jgi:cell division protein FtsI (penicillin-binding protein 3)
MLALPASDLRGRFSDPERQFSYVKKYVFQDTADRIADRRFPGIFFREATMRYYPQGSFLCHVLGFVNHQGIGSAGVEQRMDRYLRGSPGLLESQKNGLRQELYWKRERFVPALEGANVWLTIDQNVQHILETELEAVMKEHRARGACAIVQRIRTGEILAMAARPAYDLNRFIGVDASRRRCRAIGSVYEPGSTMKAATFAAAFEAGTVTPRQVFDCEHGAWPYKGRVLRDYHPYGPLTVADGIKKSSNILAAKVALTLGNRRLYQGLRRFGLGEPLGIDLPGEEGGILHPVSRWSGISPTRIAIGQGVAVTPLQMLNVFCTLANDGYRMRPYVIQRVEADDGKVLYEKEPEVLGQAVSPRVAALMRRLLHRVTEKGGTGRRARVEGYDVAGKTGTAQKPVRGGYSDTAYVASFVGFLPVDHPEIGIIVVVDEPQPLHTGGVVAAPVFSRIAEQTVRCLAVPGSSRLVAGVSR